MVDELVPASTSLTPQASSEEHLILVRDIDDCGRRPLRRLSLHNVDRGYRSNRVPVGWGDAVDMAHHNYSLVREAGPTFSNGAHVKLDLTEEFRVRPAEPLQVNTRLEGHG